MDVCRKVRWRLVRGGAPKRVKVGHGGTLDPLASGVLVVMVGKATRLCEAVMAGAKRYETSVDLSCFSSTDDAEGERTPVTPEKGVPTPAQVRAACDALTGTIMQTPPAYSAIKVGGQRAYDLARAGREVKLAARPAEVFGIEVLSYDFPTLALRIDCGKGVYIRTIARDLGGLLGTGGFVTSLRRTRVGRWEIDQAVTLDTLPEVLTGADLMAVPEG
jgi:tRNA pseudouridine55 synthase